MAEGLPIGKAVPESCRVACHLASQGAALAKEKRKGWDRKEGGIEASLAALGWEGPSVEWHSLG